MNGDLAVIALGSNLGDSAAVIRSAMDRLQELSTKPILRSSLWTSTPVDCPPGSPLFINAAAAISPPPDETPETLLNKLQAIEKEFGRTAKKVLNEPRPLDLDLIAWGDRVIESPALTLPHPRAHLRRFVLQPMAEIVPELIMPGQRAPVREILAQLQTEETVRRIEMI